MNRASAKVTSKAILGLVQLVVALALALFLPAGTWRFVEGWIFLGVFSGSSVAITVYLMRNDPKLLERRTRAGPVAEKEPRQQVIQGLAGIAFLATLILPALDHRFHGSAVPMPGVIGGDTLVALGFFAIARMFRENTFTSAVIEVAAEQRVIDTGPYASVRHPMYAGALVMFTGVPFALGSYVGLIAFVPFAAVIVWRLLEEERFLASHLAGYDEYRKRTPYRLVPHVW